MLAFETRCEILYHFYMEYAGDAEYTEFIEVNDTGVPCAYLLIGGQAILTDSGMDSVEQTWQAFCDLLEIDSYGDYDGLDAMMDLSESE